jgi:GTPase SAR1 family protein
MSKASYKDEDIPSYKVLLIGNSDVGKSSILLRFTDDEFQEDLTCTIGKRMPFESKTKDNILKIRRVNRQA